jgi:hypothetical protein
MRLTKFVVFSHGHGVVDVSNKLERTSTTPCTGLSGPVHLPSYEPQIPMVYDQDGCDLNTDTRVQYRHSCLWSCDCALCRAQGGQLGEQLGEQLSKRKPLVVCSAASVCPVTGRLYPYSIQCTVCSWYIYVTSSSIILGRYKKSWFCSCTL